MDHLTFLRVELLLLFAETLLFGAFCILYLISLWILLYRQRSSRPSASSLWMAGVVTAMFLLAGLYLVLDIRRLVAGFVNHSETTGGPYAYLFWQQGGDPARTIDPIIFILLTLLWDGFMTYRIFVVWNRQFISLLLPALLIVGNLIAAAFLGNALLLENKPGALNALFIPAIHPRLIAYFSMTLLTNLVMTVLLLGRLWWYDKQAKKYRPRHTAADSVHWRVMHTIIHSEIAYSLGVVLNLAACAARSKLVLLTSAVLPPVIGISFSLIIMRIGLSEALADAAEKGGGEGHVGGLSDPARALSHIAVSVHIAQMVDSEDGSVCEEKTVSGCHEIVEEGSTEGEVVVA